MSAICKDATTTFETGMTPTDASCVESIAARFCMESIATRAAFEAGMTPTDAEYKKVYDSSFTAAEAAYGTYVAYKKAKKDYIEAAYRYRAAEEASAVARAEADTAAAVLAAAVATCASKGDAYSKVPYLVAEEIASAVRDAVGSVPTIIII